MKISFEILKEKNGQSLAEVAIGLTIGAILISAAAFGISYMLRANANIQKSQSASAFNQELMDKVRALAGANWQTIYGLTKGTSTSYYLNASSVSYAVIEGKEGLLDNDAMSGLAGYWKFDEATSTVAYDSSGNNNSGSFAGAPTRATSTCKIGYCLSFDGTDDYINTSNFPQTTERTYTWWHNISANGSAVFPGPLSHGGYSDGIRVLWRDDTDDKVDVQVTTGSDSTPTFILQSADVDQVGVWYHYAVTYDGVNTGKLYRNGVLVDTKTNGTGAIKSTATPFRIGLAQYYWKGLIDDVRIYNRALSADEVRRLWNSNAYSRFFNIENVSRDSGGSIVTSGGTNDPSTQKVTASVQWGATGAVTEAKIVDYLTRSKNFVFRQTDWSGGSGQSGVVTEPNSKYSTSDNIDILTPGLIKILNL